MPDLIRHPELDSGLKPAPEIFDPGIAGMTGSGDAEMPANGTG